MAPPVRDPEAPQVPFFFVAVELPSGIILSGKAATRSVRVAISSFVSPFTCSKESVNYYFETFFIMSDCLNVCTPSD
jgi:hypothetical protein